MLQKTTASILWSVGVEVFQNQKFAFLSGLFVKSFSV